MDIFDVLSLIGGLCLFLFGMSVMGDALERRAGEGLKTILGKLTKNRFMGFLTGLGVTMIIQSSSATTVMVVGFVNSGIMSLKQAIGVIMGANLGTTITAWILSLGGISGDNIFIKLLKPSSFTPVLASIGMILLMFGKTSKKKDSGTILLGFATLMFGMDTMSAAVSGLSDVPAFREAFLLFTNPVLGVLVGMVLTAIIQSSSASVGILQALSVTGQVTYGAAIPIIMGQNIGTCITAILSSFGTNKNAKRAAIVHLTFNIIGVAIWLSVYCIVKAVISPAILSNPIGFVGVAAVHTIFNLACLLVLFPASSLLEKLAIKLVPDTSNKKEVIAELDERLLETPTIAIERCNSVVIDMAKVAIGGLKKSLDMLYSYDEATADKIRDYEEKADHFEDILGTYLVKLCSSQISDSDSSNVTKLLKIIGDLERISDHSLNILGSAIELKNKNMVFTDDARKELDTICAAIKEILTITNEALKYNSIEKALCVEPLEQVIDILKKKMRNNHVVRLKEGNCSIEAGFVWADLLTNLERVSDHCSNIAICIIETSEHNMNLHESLRNMRDNNVGFKKKYNEYLDKYDVI